MTEEQVRAEVRTEWAKHWASLDELITKWMSNDDVIIARLCWTKQYLIQMLVRETGGEK